MSNIDFLRIATNARRTANGEPELDPLEFYAHVMPKVERAVWAGYLVPEPGAVVTYQSRECLVSASLPCHGLLRSPQCACVCWRRSWSRSTWTPPSSTATSTRASQVLSTASGSCKAQSSPLVSRRVQSRPKLGGEGFLGTTILPPSPNPQRRWREEAK